MLRIFESKTFDILVLYINIEAILATNVGVIENGEHLKMYI